MSASDEPLTVTRRELERVFDVGRGTVQGWERHKDFPAPARSGRGRAKAYDLARVARWVTAQREAAAYDEGYAAAAADSTDEHDRAWKRERARKMRAEAEKVERENRAAAGELVSRESADAFAIKQMRLVVQTISAWPRRYAGEWAAETDPARLVDAVHADVRALRDDLERAFREWAAEIRAETEQEEEARERTDDDEQP